jgi:tripartite-type tricarboxylate transporter receptor subunit TctC
LVFFDAAEIRLTLTAAGLLAVSAVPAIAANYPDRPLRLIVPYAPGGGTDLTSRLIARHLSASFGQQVIVDKRARGRRQHRL